MTRRFAAALMALAALFAVVGPARAEEPVRIVFHLDENDPQRMNMVLNNAANARSYYESQGVPIEMEIVTYGPGVHMLLAGSSPVRDRISSMSVEVPDLAFSACGNTLAAMERKSGEAPSLIPEATVTPSGVVRLVELQRQGWAYVRP
jgi:hypothetical protein